MFSSSHRAVDTYLNSRNGRRPDAVDFQAIVFCGHGESLYPLTQGEKAVPKALLPIGNGVIIDRVLDWVELGGIRDVLLLCPDTQVAAISEHVRNSWLSHADIRTRSGGSAAHQRAAKHLAPMSVEVHGFGERDENYEIEQSGDKGLLKANEIGLSNKKNRAGEEDSENGVGDDVQLIGLEGVNTVGTGRLLRRWRDWLKSDFVVLPCDLSPPESLHLDDILNTHRGQAGSLVTSMWYQKDELELKDPDAQESVLVGYDKANAEILMVQPLEALDDDLPLRMNLLAQHPTLTLTTALQDSHVYAFKRTVLDLIMTRDPKDLDSIREDVVPWLVKGGWQLRLQDKWDPLLNVKPDPLRMALEQSTAFRPVDQNRAMGGIIRHSSPTYSGNMTNPSSPRLTLGEQLVNFKHGLRPESDLTSQWRFPSQLSKDRLRCGMVIAKRPTPSTAKHEKATSTVQNPDRQTVIRCNTVASYWALCREFLRNMPPNLENLQRSISGNQEGINFNIDAKAQVSADSLVPSSTRVGERTSIKKCLIGRHCVIGKNVRLSNVIVWDFVNIADGAKVDGSILGANVRIGEKAVIQGSELGSGSEIEADAVIKSERLVAGNEA